MCTNVKVTFCPVFIGQVGRRRTQADELLVPLAGIEPALLAELDFEFERVYQFRHRGLSRSARKGREVAKPAEYSGR